MSAATGPRREARRLMMGLATLVGLGSLMRLLALGHQSLNSSEIVAATLYGAEGSWSAFFERILEDEHPPLYPILARLWNGLGPSPGDSGEWALRLPMALVGVGTLLLAWRLGRRVLDEASALAWAAVMAVSYGLVTASQSARPYALLGLWLVWQLVATLATARAADVAAGRRPDTEPAGRPLRRPLIHLAAASALGMLTHFIAAFPSLACYGLLLVQAWRRPGARSATLRVAGSGLAAAAVFVPWYAVQLPHLMHSAGGDVWIGKLPLLGVAWQAAQFVLSSTPGALALLLVPMAGLWVLGRRRRRARRAGELPAEATGFTAPRVAMTALLVALGTASLASLATPLLMPRTGLMFTPPWYLVVALVYVRWLPALPRLCVARRAFVLPGLLGLVLLTALAHHFRMQKEDLRGSGRFVAGYEECRGTPIAVAGFTPSIYRHYVAPGDPEWEFVSCEPDALMGERSRQCLHGLRNSSLPMYGKRTRHRPCPIVAWSAHKRLTEFPDDVREAMNLSREELRLVRFHLGWLWLRRGPPEPIPDGAGGDPSRL